MQDGLASVVITKRPASGSDPTYWKVKVSLPKKQYATVSIRGDDLVWHSSSWVEDGEEFWVQSEQRPTVRVGYQFEERRTQS